MKITITADDGAIFDPETYGSHDEACRACRDYEAAAPSRALFAEVRKTAAVDFDFAWSIERFARDQLAPERIRREGPKRTVRRKSESAPPVAEKDAPSYTLPATDEEIRAGADDAADENDRSGVDG